MNVEGRTDGQVALAAELARRASLMLHVGLFVSAIGVLLPWLTVARRTRSGPDSANVLLSLEEAGGPQGLEVLGVTWYLGALSVLLGWAGVTLASGRARRGARMLLVLGMVLWVVFALWSIFEEALRHESAGPLLALAGAGLMLAGSLFAPTGRLPRVAR